MPNLSMQKKHRELKRINVTSTLSRELATSLLLDTYRKKVNGKPLDSGVSTATVLLGSPPGILGPRKLQVWPLQGHY